MQERHSLSGGAMTTTQTDRAIEAETRRELRALVTSGLREPLDAVVSTLQRLALAQLGGSGSTPGPVLDPHLLSRTRTLAHALQQAVDELIAEGNGAGLFDGREPQETVVVRTALDAAAVSAAGVLHDRNVVLRGAARHTITTSPQRFHELLTSVFEAAAHDTSQRDLRVHSRRAHHELLVDIDGVAIEAAALDQLRALARSLGGTVERGNNGVGVAIWLPQQRAGDTEN